jgi:N-acetylneuraminic acid mutarotase
MAYDAASDLLVTFGGDDFGPVYDHTWSYDVETDEWTDHQPRARPAARNFFAMTYDARSDRVLVYGGIGPGGTFLDDLWAFDVDSATWAKVEVRAGPEGRGYAHMAYDAVTDRTYLFGGVTEPDETPLDDTWAFDAGTSTWRRLDVRGPSGRGWHVLAADADAGRLVLHGGGTSREACTNETWTFDPRTTTWKEHEEVAAT